MLGGRGSQRFWQIVALGIGLGLLLGVGARAQELSGRFKAEFDLEPLIGFVLWDPGTGAVTPFPPEAEELPFLWGLTTQLDLNLKYPVIRTDNTFLFTGVGLTLAWLSWEVNFPSVEEPQAATKHTIQQNDVIKVLRTFPSAVRRGETFEVTILVEALQDLPPGAEIVVQEELPRGWALDPIEPVATRIGREIVRWTVELGTAGSRDTIRYLATVPPEAALGTARIFGTVQSPLFPSLEFPDTLEVIEGPPTLPGQVRLSQDIIFSARVTSGALTDPLGFRIMSFRAISLLQPGLRLTHYFRLLNTGTTQTPSFRWRDTITVQGQTSEGVGTRLSLRFRGEEDRWALFDRGFLQVGAIPLLPDLAVRLYAQFDARYLSDIRLSATYTRGISNALGRFTVEFGLDETLTLQILSFSARLSSELDGLFLVDDRYGPLWFDGDDDGVEEAHLTIVRRQVQLRFSLDKLDVRSISLFLPILEDIDSDGADERIARAKLVRQEFRVRRSLENVVFQGRLILTEDDPTLPTLSVAQLRLSATVIYSNLRFTAETRLDLKPLRFNATLGMTLSF